MELAMIGLGKMGGNMAERLLRGGHRVVAHAARKVIGPPKRTVPWAPAAWTKWWPSCKPPRVVWMMVPSGEVTETTLNNLLERLAPGDTIVDGGNSNYKDSDAPGGGGSRPRGLQFVDCGTSGGIWGLTEGYSLMIGGPGGSSNACGRSSRRWRPPPIPAGARSGRTAPATSSRWSTTASSTA